LLREAPQPWTAEDTPLAAMAMYFDLQGGENKSELALWQMRPHLPPALYALLTRDGTRWDAPLQGAARGDAVLPTADQVNLRTLPSDPVDTATADAKHSPGSNNFAIDASLTADGRAIVADDMHLSLRAPNIWFRARLRYPDPTAPGGKVDVQGFTLPGLPLVVAGSNGHVAWGFTNSYIDT
jgi:penicillin amidase